MAEVTAAQREWVKTILGIDEDDAPAGVADGDPGKRKKLPKWLSNIFGGKKNEEPPPSGVTATATLTPAPSPGVTPPTAPPPTTPPPTTPPSTQAPTPPPTVSKVEEPDADAPLAALRKEAEALKKAGLDVKQMLADAADFEKHIKAAKDETDGPTRTKALQAIKGRIDEAVEHAESLSKSMKSIMGDKTGAPDATQKSAIYKKALEDLYGLKIKIPTGMANTHLDRVFDMFGSVPKKDVKHDKLKSLTYSAKASDRGSGAYGSADIEMGDFGGAAGKENYEIDGEVIPANSFDVTTLHEIGHSVDEKHGIMAAHQGKDGCGGWESQTLASVTDIFFAELVKTVAEAKDVDQGALKGAVRAALNAGSTTQPNEIDNDPWQKIVAFLTTKCLLVRSASDPWFANSQVQVGGKVYQEAYSGEWWSYKYSTRGKTKVNNYQWRSPAEWFAEVYAISWLSKKKPPSGVDSAMLPYMWK